MLIIGLGNKSRQGKDIAAQAVQDFYATYTGTRYRPLVQTGIFKFATALYQEVNEAIKGGIWETRTIDGVTTLPEWVQPDSNPEINSLAPYGKHPKLLQYWGTEYRRAQDSDYWVKRLFATIPANPEYVALITDTRFPNEALGIKQRGGYCVNIQRLREDGKQYYSSDRPVDHISETALDAYNWDFRLVNSAGHQALLGEQIITLVEYLRGLSE